MASNSNEGGELGVHPSLNWVRVGPFRRVQSVGAVRPLEGSSELTETEADLEQRLAAEAIEESGIAERKRVVQEILAAAERRDAVADLRDLAADTREEDLDRAEFLSADGEYGGRLPERRAAALDRRGAKEDRIAARRDRLALARLD